MNARQGRLILVRHGRSTHVHDGAWIDREAAHRFEKAYDAAGIRDDDPPPQALLAMAKDAGPIMASDLARAVASARRLAPDREPEITPLLRELRFEIPAWGPRLPLDVWDALHHTIWTARMIAHRDTDEVRRAREAAAWIESRCSAGGSIVVTHGGFRRLLSRQLVARGWTRIGRWHPYHNWSVWTLVRRK